MSIKFFSSLGIDELVDVINALKTVNDWQSLGLQLGILNSTIEQIEIDELCKVVPCRRKMLTAWLKQKDNVLKVGIPSWSILRTALINIGENEVASHLPQKQHTCSTEQ